MILMMIVSSKRPSATNRTFIRTKSSFQTTRLLFSLKLIRPPLVWISSHSFSSRWTACRSDLFAIPLFIGHWLDSKFWAQFHSSQCTRSACGSYSPNIMQTSSVRISFLCDHKERPANFLSFEYYGPMFIGGRFVERRVASCFDRPQLWVTICETHCLNRFPFQRETEETQKNISLDFILIPKRLSLFCVFSFFCSLHSLLVIG